MKKIALLASVVTVGLLSGCASILNDKTQQINVGSSNAKEIQGTVDGVPFKGPGVVTVTRTKSSKIINVETAGCTKQTALESNVDPKFFINILTGGGLGSTTDYATEKMWKYNENVVIACGQ